MEEFQPIKQDRSVSVRIAEQIGARIEAGQFPIGTKLPAETALARQFGVSRPSVREALGALQFVGYIDSVRGSGSRVVSTRRSVSPPDTAHADASPEGVLRLFQARLLIEPQVAALAARNPRRKKLDEAEALIEGMGVVVNEPTLHGETDLRVHRALAEVCPNRFMARAALELLDVMASAALGATRTQAWKDLVLPSLWEGQHDAVIGAIRAGDPEAAASASWDHLVSSALNALRVVSQDPEVERESVDRFTTFLTEGPVSFGPARDEAVRSSDISNISEGRGHARKHTL